MTRVAFLIRFFHVVPPVPSAMKWAFVMAVVTGSLSLALHMADARRVILPIFLLQTFAAASGFAVPARRGHYDLLLTSGVTRVGIGAGHFVASTWPGVVCWVILAGIEAATRSGDPPGVAASGTVAALTIVSALSWAITVPLPRLTGAIVWLTMVVGLVEQEGMPSILRPLFMPWTLIGVALRVSDFPGTVVAMFCVIGAVTAAMSWIYRTDVSLQVAR